jgi:acetyl-CoA decarbonylase/synthase, CODH/ACS complex subunit gamma
MEIKASDIKDKLPEKGKKNCKECGVPTCFALALKLSKRQAKPSDCPYLDPAVRRELDGLLSPPMKLVNIGSGGRPVQIGDERVMFRHEQGFSHQTALAIVVSDRETSDDWERKIKKVDQFQYERIGQTYRADLLALKFDSGDRSRFLEMVKKAYEISSLSAMILSEDLEALWAARDVYADRKPLIYPITEKNIEAALPRIKERPTPVGIRADGVEALIPLTEKLKAVGIEELVLDPSPEDIFEAVQQQTILRRSAVVSKFRLLGYPAMAFPCLLTTDPLEEMVLAAALVTKYANLVVLSNLDETRLFPLFLLREDIYTDPRFMRQVPPMIYEIGSPDMDSPVLATVNGAITYFMVRAEIEQSKVPAWMAVLDTGGFSVQTALGTGKFGGAQIAAQLKEHGLAEKSRLKKIVIPRPAYVIKEELEINLPGWEVVIGPELAKEIQPMLKQMVQ